MTGELKLTGATSNLGSHWKAIDWKKVKAGVKRLQVRIAKAVREGKTNKAKSLQWVLSHSYSAKLLAVKTATSTKGARTAGVDGIKWNTPAKKMRGVFSLKRRGYKAQPLRRVEILKRNGKKRPLGIPTIKDRVCQALYLLTVQPVAETTADSKELIENNIIPAINEFLRPRGLMLSPEKTKIVGIEQGFDFLGQNLRKYRNKLITTPSKENRKSFLDGIRREIKNCRGSKTEDMINRLNPKIRGWVNYHKHIQSARAFSQASTVIFEALMRWARRRHPDKGPGWIKKKYFSLTGRKWVFSCKSKQQKGKYKIHELLKPSATKLYRHIKIKGKAHPFNPEYREYFEIRRLLSNTVAI